MNPLYFILRNDNSYDKRSPVRHLCLIVFLALISACAEEEAQLNPLSGSSTILAFGDSLTFGTGVAKNKSYPAILEQLTGISVINEGIPGEVSEKGLSRLGSLLKKHQPDLVILCHGGNDLLQKLDVQLTKNNLKAMIMMIEDHGSEIVFLSVPRPGIMLSPAPFYQEISEEIDVPIITGLLSEILSNNQLKSDTAHPNEKGYRKMARSIANLLVKRNAIPPLN